MSFSEVYAVIGKIPQGNCPRNNRKIQRRGNETGITDEDTESDSSLSTFPSQPPNRRGGNTLMHESGSRKRNDQTI